MGDNVVRLSVRELVEITYFEEDITPVSLNRMRAGTEAHLLRQSASDAQRERTVGWEGERFGIRFIIGGRMDLLDERSVPPIVEEIKLADGQCTVPLPAHRAQALCYAYCLCEELKIDRVQVCVHYVNKEGQTSARFDETRTKEELSATFVSLLQRCAERMQIKERMVKARDHSIEHLTFPYPCFRPGQREMAGQVYTAIQRKKRLFAMMPTGTGKSAAVLFPAVKAMGKGLIRQVFCLTARTTQRAAMIKEAQKMTGNGACLYTLVIHAKEKVCPMEQIQCDPALCPRAKGHFVREQEALSALFQKHDWTDLSEVSTRYQICPFELSLSLIEWADIVICDYNYLFDPAISIRRLEPKRNRIAVLTDEAHQLPNRVRDMLSPVLDSAMLVRCRTVIGKTLGRKSSPYRTVSGMIQFLRKAEGNAGDCICRLLSALDMLMEERIADIVGAECFRSLLTALTQLKRADGKAQDYVAVWQRKGKESMLTLLCRNVTDHIRSVSRSFTGSVFYSATLAPIHAMKQLMGGEEGDALFTLPSPFPAENLCLMVLPYSTKYTFRQATLPMISGAIAAWFHVHPGKNMVYFPSYAYMEQVMDCMVQHHPELPILSQLSGMGETERSAFLSAFTQGDRPVLGLAVMGGVFSESIDLSGEALTGVCVVGVGLPQVNPIQDELSAYYSQSGLNGFDYAYRFPGMQKVLQAVGRLIRSETDRGTALLIDGRYMERAYDALFPEHYHPIHLKNDTEMIALTRKFWHTDIRARRSGEESSC